MPKMLPINPVSKKFTLHLPCQEWRTLGNLPYLPHLPCFKKIHAKGGKYE